MLRVHPLQLMSIPCISLCSLYIPVCTSLMSSCMSYCIPTCPLYIPLHLSLPPISPCMYSFYPLDVSYVPYTPVDSVMSPMDKSGSQSQPIRERTSISPCMSPCIPLYVPFQLNVHFHVPLSLCPSVRLPMPLVAPMHQKKDKFYLLRFPTTVK